LSRIFVWLGGALFVGSLALCTWWYLTTLAEPSPAISWTAAVTDLGLLTVFAMHHSLFARDPIKAAMTRFVPVALQRSVYVWTASTLLIIVCIGWQRIGGTLYDVHGTRALGHAAFQLLGVGLIARSVAGIDPLELAGIREHSVSGGLQTSGPYGWVRHPLYLGWVMAVFGTAHMTGDRLAFAAITTGYLMVAVPWEERALVNTFGDEYRAYQRRIRWRIVPYVY
jgi:protein-S-isoprenylcysteine O-methyltransferase Ste14